MFSWIRSEISARRLPNQNVALHAFKSYATRWSSVPSSLTINASINAWTLLKSFYVPSFCPSRITLCTWTTMVAHWFGLLPSLIRNFYSVTSNSNYPSQPLSQIALTHSLPSRCQWTKRTPTVPSVLMCITRIARQPVFTRWIRQRLYVRLLTKRVSLSREARCSSTWCPRTLASSRSLFINSEDPRSIVDMEKECSFI